MLNIRKDILKIINLKNIKLSAKEKKNIKKECSVLFQTSKKNVQNIGYLCYNEW